MREGRREKSGDQFGELTGDGGGKKKSEMREGSTGRKEGSDVLEEGEHLE